MSNQEKKVSYTTTNTYETLNSLTTKTKNIWIVLHGIGYLSRYFIKHFDSLPPEENYIIAPQAPSKYYLNNKYRRVGTSWLTKENTTLETQNVLNYLNKVYQQENITDQHKVIILGYSQGVSIASRWVCYSKIQCNHLVLYGGIIPKELTKEKFSNLINNKTKITFFIGDKDEYITEAKRVLEEKRIQLLLDGKANIIVYDGEHAIKKEIIESLA
ncbi:putative esterase [Maribacter vaceletii]|uniref:Putative esterase n=1 Tax=Maribacter vaceletii TaxID=1206816 RepID=A0A495EAM6_9FLAO|nr:dienelactone hydrolase family protein [Maribacter vaceletii]RKR12917.1 putative esterase [Maribacter vaceletii]